MLVEQVGPGNISVVSPPAPSANGAQAHFSGAAGHQCNGNAPPEYSQDFDDGALGGFDDGAVRRGEQGAKKCGSDQDETPFEHLLCLFNLQGSSRKST